jgi:hypothetical protein
MPINEPRIPNAELTLAQVPASVPRMLWPPTGFMFLSVGNPGRLKGEDVVRKSERGYTMGRGKPTPGGRASRWPRLLAAQPSAAGGTRQRMSCKRLRNHPLRRSTWGKGSARCRPGYNNPFTTIGLLRAFADTCCQPTHADPSSRRPTIALGIAPVMPRRWRVDRHPAPRTAPRR